MNNISFFKQNLSLLFFIALGISGAAAQDSAVHQFSVEQAVAYAKKNSVAVRNALIDVQIQRQTNKEITAAAYPQINGSFNLNDYLDIPTSLLPAEITGGPAGTYLPVKFGTKYSATGALDAS